MNAGSSLIYTYIIYTESKLSFGILYMYIYAAETVTFYENYSGELFVNLWKRLCISAIIWDRYSLFGL